jgi:hypothetical protein
MKRSRKILLILMLSPISVMSQQIVSSTGAHAVGTSAQLSWTLGETMIETLTSPNAILTQGFHQSKLTVTAVDPLEFPAIKISVYPNPVMDKLLIETGGIVKDKFLYSLTDTNGRLLKKGEIAASPQSVEMGSISPGIYFMKIGVPKRNTWQIYKIVKQ